MNQQSPLLYRYFWQSFKSEYPECNSYRHVGYKIFEHLIAQGYDLSKNERVFIRDLRDLSLQMIFDGWWASMNVDSKRPIAWNDSGHASSWRFKLQCGTGKTSSPGIIWIFRHQVLRHAWEHGTSSLRKDLLEKAHIAKLNELTESKGTESTSSTVDETASAILQRQRSWGIQTVSSQRKVWFDIQLAPYGQK